MDTKAPTHGLSPTEAAQLVERHQAGVWRYLRALGCDPDEAADLTQETFLSVFRKPIQDFAPAATSAYLRKAAHHLLIDLRRRQRRMHVVEDLEEPEADWNRWANDDNGERLLEALRHCFGLLTERARLALNLRFRERASREEIAAALAITEHGAKNLMQRDKQQLRACIEGKLE